MPAADLGTSAARARQEDEVKAAEPIEAETAFIIYKKKAKDGQPASLVLTPDLNVPLIVDQPPTHDEILMYMHIVEKDIVGQQYAAMATQASLQLNNFLAQQAAGAEQLKNLGDLRTG